MCEAAARHTIDKEGCAAVSHITRSQMARRMLLALLATTQALDWVNPKYWQLQASTAKLVSACIGRGSTVLEVDAVDGAKNLYYLPLGCTVTQWLNPREAAKDIGPTKLAASKNGQGLETVNARDNGRKAPRLVPESFDACLMFGALARAAPRGPDAVFETCDAALRALKPDGRLVFVERTDDAELLLATALDDSDLVADCESSREHGAIIGVVTRGLDPAKRKKSKKKGF